MADVDDGSSPANSGLVKAEGELYIESLVRISLLLVTEEFPFEVQLHGSKMLQHLVDYRSGELNSADLLELKLQLVRYPSETAANAGKPNEHSKGNTSLLVLAANNILRSLTAGKKGFGRNSDGSTFKSIASYRPIVLSSVKRAPVFQDERVGFSLVLPSVSEDERIHVCSDICALSSQNSTSSSPEKADRSRCESSKRSHNSNTSISIKDKDEAICHQRKDSLLLTEHNLLCEAFSIPSLLGIVEYERIIPCLLDPLNKIWTLVEWKDNYVSSVSQLFSDGQFLKMAYHVVKFSEEQLKRSKTEGSGARDLSPVALFLKLILPLLLQLLQCIHAFWNEDANFLPEELERAKCLNSVELATILERTNGLYDIDNVEYLHRNKTGALLEGTRQRVYNVVGLCTSVEGVFSELLTSVSATDAFLNGLRSMELRHLGKVIRLVVVPLVKNCPCKFWKLWMVDFLGPILTECEHRLHFAWFDLLYHGGTGKPYFYGNLVGPDRQINALKQKLLLAFTREVSDLLRVLAVAEQNMESVPSPLLRFLLLHDCFKRIRMSLFGYFVDDETTMNAIPFCRSLTWLAISDMRVRHLIVNDLLPCLIQRLDNQLPCAIQHLRHKLGSSMRASASKDLEALCEEWYNNFEKGSAGERKSDACVEKNFTAWLRKKKDLQVMACSAAKELFEGSYWNWEFEDEFRRYLPDYMDMLQQVDSINPESSNKR